MIMISSITTRNLLKTNGTKDKIIMSVFYGYMIFGMKHKKRQKKKNARDNGLQGWNDVAVWRDFKLLYILTDIWPQYLEHVTSEWFTRRSQPGADNWNRSIHGSVTMHIGGSVPFAAHTKQLVRLI